MVIMRLNAQVHKFDLFILQVFINIIICKAVFSELGKTWKYVNCSPCPQGAQNLCGKIRNVGK